MKESSNKNTALLIPLILSVFIVIADQITKMLVLQYIPLGVGKVTLHDDLVNFIHVRNPGIAFSIGIGLPDTVRSIIFGFLPIIIIGLLVVFYFKTDSFSTIQRWAIAGIIGGGIGNLIDRLFREGGVVDFIDIKFFGLLGMQRWPTFNIADSAVVVCSFILMITMFFGRNNSK